MSLVHTTFTEFEESTDNTADAEFDNFWAALTPAIIYGMVNE